MLAELAKVGVAQEEVKVSSVSISSYRKKRYQRFDYNGRLAFDIPCTEEDFDAVWSVFTHLRSDAASPYFRYDLKDYEGARDRLVSRTVEMGRQRAETLAHAVGCELGPITSISNTLDADENYRIGYDGMAAGGGAPGGAGGDDSPVFNPESITVSCEVTLVYELIARE